MKKFRFYSSTEKVAFVEVLECIDDFKLKIVFISPVYKAHLNSVIHVDSIIDIVHWKKIAGNHAFEDEAESLEAFIVKHLIYFL